MMSYLWHKPTKLELDETSNYLKWASLVGACIMVGFMYQAPYTSGPHSTYVTCMRTFGATLGILFWYTASSLKCRPYIVYNTILFYVSYSIITIAIMLPRPQPYSLIDHSAMTNVLILIIGVFIFSNLRFIYSFLITCLILIMHIIGVYITQPLDFTHFRKNMLVDILVIVIGLAIKSIFSDIEHKKLIAANKEVNIALESIEKEVLERTFELQLTKVQLATELNRKKDSHPNTLRDLTQNLILDSKKLEEDLKFYKTIAEHSETPICCLDSDLRIIWANHSIVEFLGYSLESLYTVNSILDYVSDESKAYAQSLLTSQVKDLKINFYINAASGDKLLCDVYAHNDTDTTVLLIHNFIERRAPSRVKDMDRSKDRRIKPYLR